MRPAYHHVPPPSVFKAILAFAFAALLHAPIHAAKIGELSGSNSGDQALRFLTLADPAVRTALLGALLLGLTCGLLGSFLVVRRMALVGDALSHAVLPGVALGFLWHASKDPFAIFLGATVAGLLGMATVFAITSTTRIKEDAALGMVLAVYFSVGICLVTRIQKLPFGNQSGISTFLFGQAAALKPDDLRLMGAVAALVILAMVFAFKEFLLASFDPVFARVCGLPVRWLHHSLMLLLAFSVVISLQAVGVVLVSAMLITPAATAYLLTDRLHHMIWIAAAIGLLSGLLGCFLSFLGSNLPTGPFIVLAASSFFALAFLVAPRQGVLTRWWRQRSQAHRVARENTLKAVYHVLESLAFRAEKVALLELAQLRKITLAAAESEARHLAAHDLASVDLVEGSLVLTPAGWQRACEIVRNHRLWELYLTHAAHIAPDHVHDDAERIEHVLGADAVRAIERRLNQPKKDPHGRPIPSLADLQRPSGGLFETQGYGRPGAH